MTTEDEASAGSARGRNPSYVLVNPPLTDPTTPYHSASYLVGAARAQGYTNGHALDANLDCLTLLAQPGCVEGLLALAASQRRAIERQPRPLSRADELRYRISLMAMGMRPHSVSRAIDVFRSEDFYDYELYRAATLAVRRWLALLSLKGIPGQFDGFAFQRRGAANLDSLAELLDPDLGGRMVRPFRSYAEGAFLHSLRQVRPDLVGFSVNYASQLLPARQLITATRRELPDVLICAGGTEISELLKCLRQADDIWTILPECDAIVAGEGESALVHLLREAHGSRRRVSAAPGVLSRVDPAESVLAGNVVYEDLDSVGTPAYDIWDLSKYWSPEPVLLYSPTRGCYWNKCTFCDYGLNTDRPTSPSRQRGVAGVVSDLSELRRHSRFVYFAVDAMSPAFLRRLAEALVEGGVDVKWSAELRLERSLPSWDLVPALRSSGCVAMSFGFESGSQRVLDLIDKGVILEDVADVLASLRDSGIGAQMMGFIGFPSETHEEALQTFEYLARHGDSWSIAGIGDFVLTKGSIVAKKPGEFGIDSVRPHPGDDVVRALSWTSADGLTRGISPAASTELDDARRRVMRYHDDRPFVGGIDSAHSMLYFDRFGPALIPVRNRGATTAKAREFLEGASTEVPFSDVCNFVSPRVVEDRHRALRDSGVSAVGAGMRDWLLGARVPQSQDGGTSRVEISLCGEPLFASATRTKACDTVYQMLLESHGYC